MNDECPVLIPESRPVGMVRSALLLAAVQAFLDLERNGAEAKKEETLLAEYSELVVVPAVFVAE